MTGIQPLTVTPRGRPLWWLVLVATLVPVGTVSPQQETAPGVTVLRWEFLTVLVFGQPTGGVYLWSAWRDPETDEQFVGRFDPVATTKWAAAARSFLDEDRIDPANTSDVLRGPVLPDVDVGAMYLLRYRDGNRWESQVTIGLRGPRGRRPMGVALDKNGVRDVLEALEKTIGQIEWTSDIRSGVVHQNPAFTKPVPDSTNANAAYPILLAQRGTAGDVYFTFVLDETGRPDPDRIWVLYADHELFSRSSVEALRTHQYQPAVENGEPIPVQMFQRWTFRLR